MLNCDITVQFYIKIYRFIAANEKRSLGSQATQTIDLKEKISGVPKGIRTPVTAVKGLIFFSLINDLHQFVFIYLAQEEGVNHD